MTQKSQEERFDAMLRDAFRGCPEDDSLFTEEELRGQGIEPHTFSPTFEKKMKKLIREQRRRGMAEQAWDKRRRPGRRAGGPCLRKSSRPG